MIDTDDETTHDYDCGPDEYEDDEMEPGCLGTGTFLAVVLTLAVLILILELL